jgi:hypothetical protein
LYIIGLRYTCIGNQSKFLAAAVVAVPSVLLPHLAYFFTRSKAKEKAKNTRVS